MEGKYQQVKVENLDKFFEVMGAPWVARKMMAMTNPSVSITKDGTDWCIEFQTPVKTQVIKFTEGKEFVEETPLGAEWKSLGTLVDGALVLKSQTPKGEIMRTFTTTDDGIELVMKALDKDVTAKRMFKRQQ